MTRDKNVQYFHVENDEVVEIEFEDYIAGVIGSEIGNCAPKEALKAQAVASRTYSYNDAVSGKVITDESSSYQAFIAEMMGYENCKEAARLTEGEVIFYNGKPIGINCVYSSSNSGRIKSAKERWGNEVAYLISKEDKYDIAYREKLVSNGKMTLNGHGVGMSQYGAIELAQTYLLDYKQILSFYYKDVEIKKLYGGEIIVTDQEQIIKKWLESQVGNGYVYGATGWICSEAQRKIQAKQYPEQEHNIMVVSAKWDGKRCFDCAQLTKFALQEVGISIPSGATSQYNYTNIYANRGIFKNMPLNTMCLVFREAKDKQGVMNHVGYNIGDGTVIEARGAGEGVIRSNIQSYPWTHYAVPRISVSIANVEPPYQAKIQTVTGNGISLWKDRSKTYKVVSIPEGAIVTVLSYPDSYGFASAQSSMFIGVVDTKYCIPIKQDEEDPEVPVITNKSVEDMYRELGNQLRIEGYDV